MICRLIQETRKAKMIVSASANNIKRIQQVNNIPVEERKEAEQLLIVFFLLMVMKKTNKIEPHVVFYVI